MRLRLCHGFVIGLGQVEWSWFSIVVPCDLALTRGVLIFQVYLNIKRLVANDMLWIMNTPSQLRDVEYIMNTCQAMRHFHFVRQWAHVLDHLEGSNIPWIELALIAKMHYALHW
jgi:hypothetical protein